MEGEGSFSIVKSTNYGLRFSIGQSSRDLILMKEIQNFFYELAVNQGFCFSDTVIGLHRSKMAGYEDLISVDTRQTEYIENVLIPFFNKLT